MAVRSSRGSSARLPPPAFETSIVVTGSLHAAIADALAADQPPIAPSLVNNPQPALGQVSSLWMGLDAADKLASPKPQSGEGRGSTACS